MLKAAQSASPRYRAAVRGSRAVKKKTYQDNGHTLELTRRSRARKERRNPAKPSRRSDGVNLSEGRLLHSIKEPAQQGVSVRGRRRRSSVAITDSRATFPPRTRRGRLGK